MSKKISYRVRNWREYNRSLINRGNLTIWFSEDAIKSWYQKPLKTKRRTWRKYHVSVDPATHEVTAMELTEANVHDCTVLPALLSTQKNIGDVYADGAYSFKQGFDAIAQAGGTPSIPIRSGTTIMRKNPSDGERLRNKLLQEIKDAGGRIAWKKSSGHHRRSLVETHMYRLKTILGGSLRGRSFANQKTEAKIMSKVLNKMAQLGMPRSEKLDV